MRNEPMNLRPLQKFFNEDCSPTAFLDMLHHVTVRHIMYAANGNEPPLTDEVVEDVEFLSQLYDAVSQCRSIAANPETINGQ